MFAFGCRSHSEDLEGILKKKKSHSPLFFKFAPGKSSFQGLFNTSPYSFICTRIGTLSM